MKSLLAVKGFVAFVLILFLNATTDLAHKITIQNVLLKSFDDQTLVILSAVVNALILLPFILLFTPAGFLSDKFSKTQVIRYSALLSIFLAFLITLCYYQGWFVAAFVMTFLLALQSAIYSPAKYGAIKELVGTENLGPANGVVQAVTIVALLMSSILFSIVFEAFYTPSQDPDTIVRMIAPIGWILVALTTTETLLAFYALPLLERAKPDERFLVKKYLRYGYLWDNIKRLFADENIWLSILGLSLFWGVGQIVIATFPAHYKLMTGDNDAVIIQGILAVSAIGIVLGSLVAGRLSYHHIELGIVPVGALGLGGSLMMFAYSQEVSYMMTASMLFGFFGGLFIVPLNALIQFFAHDDEMGTIMAGNNFIQNVVMIALLILSIVIVSVGYSSFDMFVISAALTFIAAVYGVLKLPHLFIRILIIPMIRSRYSLRVEGIENLPQSGGVLLLGNHISWIDWLVLQIASPRAVKFVMERSIYKKWYVNWLIRHFKIIPISEKASKEAFGLIRERLDNGEVVALFPEGIISYDGEINRFKKGFELASKGSEHLILPFYIGGLWGSRFSRSKERLKETLPKSSKRHISVAFGQPMPASSSAEDVEKAVKKLAEKL